MEDRKEIIKYFEERLKDLPDGQKIKLSNEEILKYFFVFNKNWNYYNAPYYQCVAEDFLQKIDLTNFVKEYSTRINMLVGANLAGAKFEDRGLHPTDIKFVFLNPNHYKMSYLREIDAINRLHTLPTTNLSNMDLSREEWDLAIFLDIFIDHLKTYVKEKYKKELYEEEKIWRQIDATPHILSFLDKKDLYAASDKVIDAVAILAKKLIPNLQNTKLRIKFLGCMSSLERHIINFALESGYFDGCYVRIDTDGQYNTINNDELYYYDKIKSKKL